MINYEKAFALLAKHNINTIIIRQKKIISESALQSMRRNEFVSLKTINKLCRLLNCQPGDLMEYVPDEEESD